MVNVECFSMSFIQSVFRIIVRATNTTKIASHTQTYGANVPHEMQEDFHNVRLKKERELKQVPFFLGY